MFYAELEDIKASEFRRLTGVKRATFEKILTILKPAEKVRKARGGRPHTLIMEDRLLMALSYWREYRTYFHIAVDFKVSESACFRTIVWIENTLVASKVFALPGRGQLQSADNAEILIDVSESPVERPQKSRSAIIRERKNATQ